MLRLAVGWAVQAFLCLAAVASAPETCSALPASTTPSPHYISGQALAQWCLAYEEVMTPGVEGSSSQITAAAECSSYIDGVADAVLFYQMSEDKHVCLPADAARAQVQQTAINFIRANPSNWNLSASQLIFAALATAFPCK